MRAMRVRTAGATPVLEEVAIPEPGPGEVRLRIMAAGLNFADLLVARAQYQEKPAFPLTLGMEAAGVVDAAGPGVAGLRPGAPAVAYGVTGALAEYGCFPAAQCTPLPAGIPFEDAAALQIAYGTSYLALAYRAALRPGETLAVLGAAGGVGLTAVEMGHRLGARVIAVARGADKLAAARAAGANEVIDSETDDLAGALRGLGGTDVVYDPVGGAAFHQALRSLRPGGRMLTIGFASGDVPEVALNRLLVKNISVVGFWWGGYVAARPEALSDSLSTIFGWYLDGSLRPHVGQRLPLAEAGKGLELLRNRTAIGKIVVTTD